MGPQNTVQFVALICFATLITLVVRSSRFKEKSYLLIYLVAAAAWSFTSFMSTSPDLSEQQRLVWTKTVVVAGTWAIVAYSAFINLYVRGRARLINVTGYGYLLLITALTAGGLLHENYEETHSYLPQGFGYWLILMASCSLTFLGYSMFLLIKGYRGSTNPDHRNRLKYLMTGLGCFIGLGIIYAVDTRLYSIDQGGQIINATLISYVMLKDNLLDMKLVLRKGIVYTGISLFITICCFLLIASWTFLLSAWSSSMSILTTIAIVIIMSMLFNPIRDYLEKSASVLFYGKSYDYRKTLLNFSGEMCKIIDLQQLAEAILSPLINAVRAKQASLLFISENYYTSRYSRCYAENDRVVPIALRRDSAIITWLACEGKPLTRDLIYREPRFQGVSEEVREVLRASELEILCPIKSKQKLVAVLALSKKYQRGHYSRDDMDLLMTLSNEAAVAIENAELYEKARQRAITDELTSLFNHRFFHQRLEEEIARSSRFGKVFTMVLLDVDYFKKYNDSSGHLVGDEVLKNIARQIKATVRDSDICFRYGGDEFALILTETSVEGGRVVAERIRKSIESRADWPGRPLTVSIGVASWPTDGVLKDDLIHAADAALYYSKQTGKNRVSLACEVALSGVFQAGLKGNTRHTDSEAVLNTIYALAATVDAKDHNTYGHSKKVSRYAVAIAEELGFNEEEVERIRATALLHDIGKIGIPDHILQKKSTLDEDEKEVIQAHPNLGVSIIQHVDSLRGCLAGVQYHHERYGGGGYPSGLKGNNIPIDARILAVADAFDAMTSTRPYRKTLGFAEAVKELQRCAGTQFDPQVVQVFARISHRLEPAAAFPDSR